MNDITENLIYEELPRKWGWLFVLGLLMIFLGTLGIYLSVWVTLATVLVFGGFVLAGGVLQLIQGLKMKEERWAGRLTHFFIALLYILMGGLIIYDPVGASLGITLAIAALLVVIGGVRISYAFKCRKQKWGWVLPLVFGLIDLVLATIIFIGWPVTGLWVIGLFVSIEMIMNGWYLTLLGMLVRKMVNTSEQDDVKKS